MEASSQSWVAAAIVLLGVTVLASQFQATIYQNFPRVGRSIFPFTAVHERVEVGYKKITKPVQKPFVLRWWAKDYILLPPKYLLDLRSAGWRHLSFFQNISDVPPNIGLDHEKTANEGSYQALYLHRTVGDLYSSDRMVDVVKKGLNPLLPRLTQIMVEEIAYAFDRELGTGQEWKRVTAMKFFSSIAHRAATRIMIGQELCRDEAFILSSMSFLESIFMTALVIVKLPLGPFRELLAWPITLSHRLKLMRCTTALLPIVKARMAARKNRSGAALPEVDAIEWTLTVSKPEHPHNTPEKVAEELAHGLWAASSAPGGLMTEMVYQLLLEPEYLTPLRLEVESAFAAHGWTPKMLNSLYLQDSFIREVNRLFPTGSVTCSRTVMDKPFTFSDGLTLPVGTRFGFPIKALQHDPDNFSQPDRFDGFRFAKQSSSESQVVEDSRRWSASSMDTTNLAFGYGNHVCPGRFYAVREVKMVFSKLIMEFDIEWDRLPGTGRPKAVHVEGQFVPNMSQEIRVRRRQETR